MPHGGVEAVSVNLARTLAGFPDLDIDVVTTHPSYGSLVIDECDGVTVHRLPWAGGKTLSHATGPGRRQIQEYLARLGPDVVHAHDTCGLMVKGMDIPRVFTIHGFIYGDTLLSGRRLARLRSWLWRRVETAGWADQPHIISISPYVRERLGGIATGVIHDIDNPISEACFDVERHERAGTIFSAALICPRKNTVALIDAAALLVERGIDVELRLAGSVSSEAYGQLVQSRIAEKNLGDRVVLLGRIGMEQVREELASASVFALASLEENSPMGIEEAMAVGVPVVTSNRCGMPYMVRDGESGFLVDPNDPDDIAWRLGQVLSDDDLRRQMGAKSREIALDRFHPTRVAERTVEVYRRAIRDYERKKGNV